MDGIEKIIQRINAAAAEECAAIAQKAEAESEVIRAEYAQKLQKAYENAIHSGEREIDLDADRVVRNARLNARKQLLGVKQELLDTAFEAARKELCAMPEDKYIDWLAKLACQTSDGSGEIILSPKDAAIGEKLVAKANEALSACGKKAELKLSAETRDIEAGFILQDGKMELNCSLSAIMEVRRQDIAAKVAEKLFC